MTGRDLPWVAGLLLAGPGDTPDDRIGEAVEQVGAGDRELLERLALAPDGLMLRTLQHASGRHRRSRRCTVCGGWSPTGW